jgi:hypothetical protein
VAGGRSRRQKAGERIFDFPFIISHFPLKTGPVKTRAMQAMKNKKSEMENGKCVLPLPPGYARSASADRSSYESEGKFASGGKAP